MIVHIVLSGESRDDASYRLPRLKSDRLAAFRKVLHIYLLHAFSLLLLSLFAVYIAIGHRCSILARAVFMREEYR